MPVKVSHDHFLIIQIGRSILKSIISPPTSVHLFLALISALAMVWIFILKTRLYKISALNSNPEYVRSIFSWCKRYEKKKKFSLFTISKVMNGTSGQFYSFFANIDFAFSWGTGFWISYERYYNQLFRFGRPSVIVLSTGRIIGRKDTLSDATYAGKDFYDLRYLLEVQGMNSSWSKKLKVHEL